MIYQLLKNYIKLGTKFFYKNIFIYHENTIDNDIPIIFASNHPAGFYEAMILTCIVKKPVYFLVRSDYVNIPKLKWFFKIIKLLPIYRQSEGLNDVKKNNEVFQDINEILKENAFVGIFPEGTTKYQFKLNPLKKGISRISIGALKAGIRQLNIIPVGFNFSRPDKFRSYLCIYEGQEIKLTSELLKDKKEAVLIREMTSIVKNKMTEVNIDIKDDLKQTAFSNFQIIIINNNLTKKELKPYARNTDLPKQLKIYSKKIDKMDKDDFSKFNSKITSYFDILSKNKINDSAVINNKVNIINTISLILGFPMFVIGFLLNILPVIPAVLIVKKYTKEYEYKAVLKVLIAQVLYAIYYVIIITLGIVYFHLVGLIFIFLPFSAWYSIKYYDLLTDYTNSMRFNKSQNKEEISKLRMQVMKSFS